MKNKGFTLLEITIVISIVIFLGTIFFVDYRGVEKQFSLKRSAHQLSQGLRKAQELALSCQKTSAEFVSENFPAGGYGIYFEENANSYILFADCNINHKYEVDGSAESCDLAETGGFPEKIEEIFLEKNIYISSLSPALLGTNCPISQGRCLIVSFFPPDPTVYINGEIASGQASIILTFDGESKKTITINKTGLVDILSQ